MKLIANASMLGDKPTGLGVYSINCVNGLVERLECSVIGSKLCGVTARHMLESPSEITLGTGYKGAIKRVLWLKGLRIEKETLVYSPTHHGLGGHDNQIITIHDLISLRYPRQHILQYIYFRLHLPRMIKRCRAIFTVSETSKLDISTYYKYPLSKIFVVPNCIDPSRFAPCNVENSAAPYLLMVGASYPHKNVEEVLDCHHLWADKYDLCIVSCAERYRAKLKKKISRLGLSKKIRFVDYASLDSLRKFYQGATALIYPSRWEGFGIPPLESLACGTPVVVSDIPVLKEVLGDAAVYIKLGDPGSWEAAFDILNDSTAIRRKASMARERLGQYTPEGAVDQLIGSLIEVEPRVRELCFSK